MARKFLYVVAALIVLVIAALSRSAYAGELTEVAFVPTAEFATGRAGRQRLRRSEMWIARPGIERCKRSGALAPPGLARRRRAAAAVFFVHPTSYFDRAHWNAPSTTPSRASSRDCSCAAWPARSTRASMSGRRATARRHSARS